MAVHTLSANFASFFGRLNPSATSEQRASSQYNSLKALLEGHPSLKGPLNPLCFLQGSYGGQTATHDISDIDIVLLCRNLCYPPNTHISGPGTAWGRDRVFGTIESVLRGDQRYASKLIPTKSNSMCIKLDLGIKVEILPVVQNGALVPGNKEPFYLWRPSTAQWEYGYAMRHREHLSYKNRTGTVLGGGTNTNFIPMIKVIKHLRDLSRIDAVSFHIETLLFSLADHHFQGAPADYITAVLRAISASSADQWYAQRLVTPCGDRNIFTATEWKPCNWIAFHNAVSSWAVTAGTAAMQMNRNNAISWWQYLFGQNYFPAL
jgi:hypothetical protein